MCQCHTGSCNAYISLCGVGLHTCASQRSTPTAQVLSPVCCDQYELPWLRRPPIRVNTRTQRRRRRWQRQGQWEGQRRQRVLQLLLCVLEVAERRVEPSTGWSVRRCCHTSVPLRHGGSERHQPLREAQLNRAFRLGCCTAAGSGQRTFPTIWVR